MLRVTNENMANAIRIVTVEQGIDPRELVLVAFGGAGPTHAADIADAIDMRRVLVPPSPGVCSAFGTLVRRCASTPSASVFAHRPAHVGGGARGPLRGARGAGARRLRAPRAAPAREPELRRSIAMRYQGQNYEQEVALRDGPITDEATRAVFARLPPRSTRSTTATAWRRSRSSSCGSGWWPCGRLPTSPPPTGEASAADGAGGLRRRRALPGPGDLADARLRREGIAEGTRRDGPLVVESMDSTFVVPAGPGRSPPSPRRC